MGLRTRYTLLTLFCLPLAAQTIDSRAAEIEAMRDKKARELKPEESTKIERALVTIKEKKILERLTAGVAGFRVKFGGLVTGSGFAIGPEYLRRDLAGGRLLFRSSARASFKGYQLYDIELGMPKLADDRLFWQLYAAHRNYPSLGYYGPGPDSAKTGRSNYRLEDTSYDFTTGVKPQRHLKVGVTGGFVQVNVGPGTESRYISAERIYSPAQAPGIDRQGGFLRGGTFAQFDTRDNPGGPRRGGNYLAHFTYNSDRDLQLHSFRLINLEAQHYIPFFNERRVIALRARTVLTDTNRGQTVPFYLQPMLGGSETMRGFRNFRFHDNNMMVYNAEYRWESFSGLDMALFVDAGKVFPRREDWDLKDLEASYGFGMRFNVRNDVFLRIDVGFSHEGFQFWFKFNNVF